MPIYRIELDAYNSRADVPGARIVTYSQGCDPDEAVRRLKGIVIASDGTVSDGINPWPGTLNLPTGPHRERSLPEWAVVSIRAVPSAGTARIVTCGCCDRGV